MEIKKEVFEKYANGININDIKSISSPDLIDKYVQKFTEDLDNMFYEFLTENGYKIDKPYNIKQLKAIKEDLEKQDKFVDYLEYIEFSDNCNQAYHYIIPFFNSISNPLTEETRNEIIEKWKERNRKDK